jgi:hypothetical protein
LEDLEDQEEWMKRTQYGCQIWHYK